MTEQARPSPSPDAVSGLALRVLAERYAVCRLAPADSIPPWAWTGALASVTRTPAELSIVCAAAAVPASVAGVERGWRALAVVGPLDFSLVGILATLTAALARAGVPLFALSTYDTDYLLVRASDLDRASEALRRAGCSVADTP